MKKTILLAIGLGITALSFSSCGGLGGLNFTQDNETVVLLDAVEKQDFAAIISLNPAFEQVYNSYANSSEKKRKVLVFANDMLSNMERKEPGSNMILLNMLSSKNKELMKLAIETAVKKFDQEVFDYAGTLEPEKVFQKILKDY